MTNKQISALVKKFCQQFGDLRVARDSEFAYFYSEDLISYTTNFTHNADKVEAFKNHIYQTYDIDLDDDKAFFIFSLLHEIGHYMTMDTMSQKELIVEVSVRKLLQERIEMEENIYFKLPSEVLANDWASDYYLSHFNEIFDFFEDLHF